MNIFNLFTCDNGHMQGDSSDATGDNCFAGFWRVAFLTAYPLTMFAAIIAIMGYNNYVRQNRAFPEESTIRYIP